ncbi:MAG: hypothetical protein M0P49_04465 [Bacilli bacterium]|nr:hypothetical protein [Bacilli bacterium]
MDSNEVQSRIVRGPKESNIETNTGVIKILREDKTISRDMVIESLKQYLSYHFIRITSDIYANTGIDVYTMSNKFFENLSIEKYIYSDNRNVHDLFVAIIFAEIGKLMSIAQLIKPLTVKPSEIKKELESIIYGCVAAVRK